MKKKAKASKRNRHTGRINAFKQSVIDGGKIVPNMTTQDGRSYYRMYMGPGCGHSIVAH